MDLDNSYAPPINNACVPDVYNRLDAEVIERTKVANKQLNMKLLLEHKIISKYKQEAERYLLLEKSRMTRELARITQTLPDCVSVRDFDEKISGRNPRTGYFQVSHKKSYLSAKNEDPVCRRCFIHHLPTKKKFYGYMTPAQLPIIQDSKLNTSGNHQYQKTKTKPKGFSKNNATENDITLINDPESEDAHGLHPGDPTKKLAELIPPVEKFKFLEKDKWGREIDLNHTLTPRLMPNEIWKNVVKNVCNQSSNEQEEDCTQLSQSKDNDIVSRGRVVERKTGKQSRKHSLASSEKLNQVNASRPRETKKDNSRMNLHS